MVGVVSTRDVVNERCGQCGTWASGPHVCVGGRLDGQATPSGMFTLNGWTCPTCRQWVPNGCVHHCGTFVEPLGPDTTAAPNLTGWWPCQVGGPHDWLPWARLDDGTLATRCTRCRREERWPQPEAAT
jgi:hypothetical protein